jgi:hypothetical protein
MATCVLMSFDPNGDPSYKKSNADRLIGLRSSETHSEFQFSARYGGVSASATMADDCHCFRFKNIDYTKHLRRWKAVYVYLTDEQEDAVMLEACKMAGLPPLLICAEQSFSDMEPNQMFYREGALKYDLLGVSFSFVSPKWRIWRPHDKWVWCSEAVAILLRVADPDFDVRPDEQTPQSLRENWIIHVD